MDDKLYLIIWSIHAVLAVVATVSLFRNPRFQGPIRIMILLPILFVPIIGSLIYFVLRDAEVKGYRAGPKNPE